jgi:hypothetical protein
MIPSGVSIFRKQKSYKMLKMTYIPSVLCASLDL